MTVTPAFEELLVLVDDRSAALRDAVSSAPDTGGRVPGCPDWSLRDLVEHLGAVQRFWAAAVEAGSVEGPPSRDAVVDPVPGDDLLGWSADSTRLLLAALRGAGPDRPCWTWWAASGAPMTAGAVARHQVQEAAVHAYDAQETTTGPAPVPASAAVDGVDEFLTVSVGSSGAWPHRPARIALRAVEGPSWLIDLTPSGVTTAPAATGEPSATVHATASDLLLALYGRIPMDRVRVDGDRTVVGELLAWVGTD